MRTTEGKSYPCVPLATRRQRLERQTPQNQHDGNPGSEEHGFGQANNDLHAENQDDPVG